MNSTLSRWILAGPLTLIAAVLGMAAMTVWVPPGSAGVNHVALAVFSFPAWWALGFFYALLEARLNRAYLVFGVFIVVNGILVSLQFVGGS